MSLDIVQGESRNRLAARTLAEKVAEAVGQGTLYLGYPVLTAVDDRVDVDGLIVSAECGLVAFLLAEGVPHSSADWARVVSEQDRLYTILESHLGKHDSLRDGRRLRVVPQTATVFSTSPKGKPEDTGEGEYLAMDEVGAWIQSLDGLKPDLEKRLHSALQRVATMKPRKRRSTVTKPSSRGAILKKIEGEIANLDQWQKAAAIESPEAPQRIRGLAGSGKTVVLALKAAYWHAQHPDWRIAFTFHSRALYQQIDDLVTRFTFEHTNDRPDPERLQIMHSWGSRGRRGVYSAIASALGAPVRDWAYARGTYGMDDAFQGICRELLEVAEVSQVEPIFDAVLIDEAQDLPPEFFRLVYLFTEDPKRIVWGFDELQKLSESAMPSTDELFGLGANGESLVTLASQPGEPRRDIVLPVCYRNTPWALATAHALGLGVYREGGLLQHPDEPRLWADIGYNVVHGDLEAGSHVTLERSLASFPEYFPKLLDPADAVLINTFDNERSQDAWVGQQIAANLESDELEPDDILIVLPDAYRAKSRAPRLMTELRKRKIESHLVGVTTSVDELTVPGSVAIAHIYRAKGNEAPMVYTVDSQYAAGSVNSVTRRNTLFTAITRSRAWVRITGWGAQMTPIASEAREILTRDFRLEFTIPTQPELQELRHLHRDRSEDDERAVKRATEGLAMFLEALERGDIEISDLPPNLRTKLALGLREGNGADDS